MNHILGFPKKALTSLLAVMLFFTAACNTKAKEVQKLIETAEQFLTAGSYEEAIAAFNQAIEIDPKNPAPYHGLYNLYTSRKNYVSARDSILRGISATGADVEGTALTYRDAIDALTGVDLLIHDYLVITKILSNPLRVVTTEGDNVYQADYDYEFDANGRITVLRVTTDGKTEETRYTYNDAGVVATMNRSGISGYTLNEGATGYTASYNTASDTGTVRTEIRYDKQGQQTSRTILTTNDETGETTRTETTYSYDDKGELLSSRTTVAGISAVGTAEYERSYPKKIAHGRTVMNSLGKLFDTEEYDNQFDEYERIRKITITCVNSETSESSLWQTTDYYYYDTIGG
ncbi:MAG: tetratricopeptide repeat protein, partial [Solobacterium sp.]|nr:tetratricopeptide repeat protein [Solobacterium sp.]